MSPHFMKIKQTLTQTQLASKSKVNTREGMGNFSVLIFICSVWEWVGKNKNAKHFHLKSAVQERACMMKLSLVDKKNKET